MQINEKLQEIKLQNNPFLFTAAFTIFLVIWIVSTIFVNAVVSKTNQEKSSRMDESRSF